MLIGNVLVPYNLRKNVVKPHAQMKQSPSISNVSLILPVSRVKNTFMLYTTVVVAFISNLIHRRKCVRPVYLHSKIGESTRAPET